MLSERIVKMQFGLDSFSSMVSFSLALAMNMAMDMTINMVMNLEAMLGSTRSVMVTRPSTKILAMSLVEISTTGNRGEDCHQRKKSLGEV
jgi:hypothetical protein